MPFMNPRRWMLASAICSLGFIATGDAAADLREEQVLVLYDSRIPDSVAVAAHYAGSAQVPQGAAGQPGVHPGVRVLDLASIPGAGVFPPTPDITYAEFVARLRNPLRTYLAATNTAGEVRCITLTKGLPHRIQDIDAPGSGDQPAQAAAEVNAGDATYASVDSELTLLWQDLNAGEMGDRADSLADGGIINPYFKIAHPIDGYSTANQAVQRTSTWPPGMGGIMWRSTGAQPFSLTPGDMYLVCRLDGHTVADVIASVNRAQNVIVDLDAALLLFDESGSDGVQNLSDTDGEFDNDGPVLFTNGGDDYEQARDWLLADGRFTPGAIVYNSASGAGEFLVGPLMNFGGGQVIGGRVLLLASYGANHNGLPAGAGTQYASSFLYHDGAIFNTIESFNGRQFGGLGLGPVPQEQLADFLAAGGTFGIGNVWEPFSFSIPDNFLLVRNFYLGGLTWAEAAYSSLPLLSWQQVVVGDPLARAFRPREDLNGDQALTVEDMYAWHAPASRPPDLNRSGAVDRADIELFRNNLRFGESANMRPVGR